MTRLMYGVLILVTAVSLTAGGCGPGDQASSSADVPQSNADNEAAKEFDPHDIPITADDVERPKDFGDSLVRIKKYRDDIEVAAGGDTPGLAHRPLDELDVVLQWLPGIARDSDVPKEHWETINTAANEMREFFEKVHQNIDNKVDPDFASVADQIDARIINLQTLAESPATDQ